MFARRTRRGCSGKHPAEAATPGEEGIVSERGEVDLGDLCTREEFTQALVALKKTGLTVRQIARKTGKPHSTVGGYFSGKHLPQLNEASILTDILAVCGVDDPDEVAEWLAALERVTRCTGRTTSPSPYRGLARFERDDTEWFFGRDEAIARLAAQVEARAAVGGRGSAGRHLRRRQVVTASRRAAARPRGRLAGAGDHSKPWACPHRGPGWATVAGGRRAGRGAVHRGRSGGP